MLYSLSFFLLLSLLIVVDGGKNIELVLVANGSANEIIFLSSQSILPYWPVDSLLFNQKQTMFEYKIRIYGRQFRDKGIVIANDVVGGGMAGGRHTLSQNIQKRNGWVQQLELVCDIRLSIRSLACGF